MTPNRRYRALWMGVLALGLAMGPRVARAQTARSDEIFYAVDFASGSSTGGIQEAINACGDVFGDAPGCVVVMPRGQVDISATIEIGKRVSSDAKDKYGIVLKGHGSSPELSTGVAIAGTTLKMTGTLGVNRAVLRIWDVSWSRFQDFHIDGDDKANIGIEMLATTGFTGPPPSPPPTGSGTSQQNVFENISIENIATSGMAKGIAINVNATSNCECQASETSFRNITTRNVPIGFQQDGAQTTGMRIEDSNITATYQALNLLDGLCYVSNTFLGGVTPGMDADVNIGPDMNDVVLNNVTHETCAKAILRTQSDVNVARIYPTVLINEHMQHYGGVTSACGENACTSGSPCYFIDHQGPGPLTLLGGFYHVNSPMTSKPRIKIDNNGSSAWGPTHVFTAANFFSSDVDWQQVTANRVFINSFDQLPGQFASMTWDTRNVGGGSDNPMVLHNWSGTGLEIISWITQAGDYVFRKDNAALMFQSADFNNSVKLKATTSSGGNNTLTLPNVTGGVLVDTATQTVTNKNLTSGTNTFPSSLATDSGSETLTNKGLSDPSNAFPELTAVTFTNPGITGSTTTYCGPNTSLCDATEANASLPYPRSVLRKLTCKAKVAPGGSRTVVVQVRSGTNNAGNLTCTIGSSSTSCSNTTSTDVYATGAEANLDVRFVSSGSGNWPSGLVVACSILTKPGDN